MSDRTRLPVPKFFAMGVDNPAGFLPRLYYAVFFASPTGHVKVSRFLRSARSALRKAEKYQAAYDAGDRHWPAVTRDDEVRDSEDVVLNAAESLAYVRRRNAEWAAAEKLRARGLNVEGRGISLASYNALTSYGAATSRNKEAKDLYADIARSVNAIKEAKTIRETAAARTEAFRSEFGKYAGSRNGPNIAHAQDMRAAADFVRRVQLYKVFSRMAANEGSKISTNELRALVSRFVTAENQVRFGDRLNGTSARDFGPSDTAPEPGYERQETR